MAHIQARIPPRVICGDALELDFPPESFEAVAALYLRGASGAEALRGRGRFRPARGPIVSDADGERAEPGPQTLHGASRDQAAAVARAAKLGLVEQPESHR
jgi:hypothetical protein